MRYSTRMVIRAFFLPARGVERSSGRELLVGIGTRDLEHAHTGRSHSAELRSGIDRDLLGTDTGIGRCFLDERQLHVVELRIVIIGLHSLDRNALGYQRRDFTRNILDGIDTLRLDGEACESR